MESPLAGVLNISSSVIFLEADGDFDADGGNEGSPATTRLSNKQPVEINGAWFHSELIEVNEAGEAVNPSLQENIDAVATLCGDRPATIALKGKTYVAVIFPHAA